MFDYTHVYIYTLHSNLFNSYTYTDFEYVDVIVYCLSQIRFTHTPIAEDVDVEELVSLTDLFSGAEVYIYFYNKLCLI